MKKIGVVGATGYTGVELLRLLATHAQVELVCVTSRGEAGKRVDALFPNLRGYIDLEFSPPESAVLSTCDLVFFATPNGIAMQYARELLDAGVRVIDLAADFRIRDVATWQKWYGMTHACPELLNDAVYGLPELNRTEIRSARLVANPGCYPTAVTLGLLPLLENNVIDVQEIVADTKSGASGAGRKASVATLLCEASDSFKAYASGGHRHHPEIAQTLQQISGQTVDLTFLPHLLPMIRGIHATLYTRATKTEDLQHLYEQHYAGEMFVDVLPAGSHPETRSVRGSNYCRIAVTQVAGSNRIIVLSVIDNLVKGAAGQAVQNMNLMLGFDEPTAIDHVGLLP